MRHSKINGLNSRSTTLRAAIVPTAFLLFVGIVFLVYLLHIDSSNSHTNTSELIKETPFENLHPEFENSYYIGYCQELCANWFADSGWMRSAGNRGVF